MQASQAKRISAVRATTPALARRTPIAASARLQSKAVARTTQVAPVAPRASVLKAAGARAGATKVSAVAEGASPAKSSGKSTGDRHVVITGASSGLGLRAAASLAKSGDHQVIMACRDFSKAEKAAKEMGMPAGSYTVMHLDLSSLESVRQFAKTYKASGLPIDALVCNAALYLPTDPEPSFTSQGFERSVGTNHLGHFLLCHLLVDDVAKSQDGRVIIVGSVTGNTNTLAGQVPPLADLGDLRGLSNGLSDLRNAMIDGGEYDGAKAYKDSKVCNMLTMREMDRRWSKEKGITFGSLYPGCVAETGLFREKRAWFRWLFPRFQKYVTKGYVSQEEAGSRLAQVVSSPETRESGRYWSWNGEAKSFGEGSAGGSGGLIFENAPSNEVMNDDKAAKLWDLSIKAVGL